jgi:ribosome-associated protein
LYDDEKQIIRRKLKNRINSESEIVLVSSVERSQWRNKEKVIQKFYNLIEEALTPVKKRIKTKPTISSKTRRIERKKQLSLKKRLRKKPDM